MVMTMRSLLAEYDAEYERREAKARLLNEREVARAVLDSAHEALDRAIALADRGIERLTEAEEAITTVRSQRDATLQLLKRYEAERSSYRMQGYAFGFILGVAVAYAVLS